jgi:hypothetical protein
MLTQLVNHEVAYYGWTLFGWGRTLNAEIFLMHIIVQQI